MPVWLRTWPFAVEKTNAVANDRGHIISNSSGNQQQYANIDTLNTPEGQLIEVFLATCRSVGKDIYPFADGSLVRQMRDCIVSAPGQSGLMARCRLTEHLPLFLHTDRDWAKQYLVDPLSADDVQFIALWRKAAHRSGPHLIELVPDKVIEKATDHRLGQRTRESLVFCLVMEVLTAFRDNRKPLVAESRVLQMLRSADDETRLFAARAIRQFGEEAPGQEGEGPSAGDLFHAAVKPFFQRVWPQENDLTTRDTSRELSHIPAASGEAFSEAVDVIKDFLIPFDCWFMLEYGLYGDVEVEGEFVAKLRHVIDDEQKARALLKLLALTVGSSPEAMVPHDLSDALDRIETLDSGLVTDPEFRRLSAAARRLEQP